VSVSLFFLILFFRRVKRTYVTVRPETKDTASCFFTDLWQLNGDRTRGAPSKECKERERARDLLVASYVSSYDVSSNPSVVEGESMQSVKNNRRSLVEHWWHCSSGRAQEMRVANEWSAGISITREPYA
jgi:hypothetical protein